MKNKGFTLIELLGVVILLTVISLLTVPAVNNSIKKNKEKLYQTQLENIKTGLKNWAIDNSDSLPSLDNDIVTLTLAQLKQGNYVDTKIKNPKTDECFPNDMLVTITNYNGSYLYMVIEDSGTSNNTCDIYSYTAPTIILNGNALEYVDLNSTYIDSGVVARTSSGVNIDNITRVIKNNGTVVSSIDTSSPALYTITYSVTDNGETTEVTRTIIVKDMTPPSITVPENIAISVDDISSFNVMEGVSATDNSGETINVTSSGNLSGLKGKYTIVYTAVDSTGNVSTKKRVITVVDNIFEIVAKDSLYSITINSNNDIFKTYFYINNVGYTLNNSICIDTSNGNAVVTNTSNLELGTHNITCTINSSEGTTSSASTTINVLNVFEIVAKESNYIIELGEDNDVYTTYFEVDDSANSLKSNICTDKYNGGTVITNTSQLELGSHVIACQINNDSTTSIAYTTVNVYRKGVDILKDTLLESDSLESGLYLDDDGVYRYKGSSPNNYIKIGTELYRVMTIESQGIKVIKDSSLGAMSYDNLGVRGNNGNNTYCRADYGCNAWAIANEMLKNGVASNTFDNGSVTNSDGTVTYYQGTVTENSSINDYLNITYYEDALIDYDDYIVSNATWNNIGGIYLNAHDFYADDKTYAEAATEMAEWSWKGRIAMISVNDYIFGQLPGTAKNSCLTNILYNSDCNTDNWLGGNRWTINMGKDINNHSIYMYSGGGIARNASNGTAGIYPTLYLKLNVAFDIVGTGSFDDPYSVVALLD